MKSKGSNKQRQRLLRQIQRLSDTKVNDAVKLAYLSQEQMELIDQLDLTALTEFKRSGNGAVEMKFNDRMKSMEKLLALTEQSDDGRIESLLDALCATPDEVRQ